MPTREPPRTRPGDPNYLAPSASSNTEVARGGGAGANDRTPDPSPNTWKTATHKSPINGQRIPMEPRGVTEMALPLPRGCKIFGTWKTILTAYWYPRQTSTQVGMLSQWMQKSCHAQRQSSVLTALSSRVQTNRTPTYRSLSKEPLKEPL